MRFKIWVFFLIACLVLPAISLLIPGVNPFAILLVGGAFVTPVLALVSALSLGYSVWKRGHQSLRQRLFERVALGLISFLYVLIFMYVVGLEVNWMGH